MTPDIKQIVVPTDFSPCADGALEYARGVAERYGAAIHLVHVCEVPSVVTGSMDAYAIAYGDWSQRLGEEAERQLAVMAKAIAKVPVTTEVLFGNPARAIVATATSRKCDLIVMGTNGHGPVMHLMMGNVAERVVRTAPCPVLTVREPRAKEPAAERPSKAADTTLLAAGVLAVALLAPAALPSPAAAQTTPAPAATQMRQTVAGRELFRTYCTSCHGPAARGDGPLAASMTKKPPDLTKLAERNGGEFPSEMVYRTIDGKQPVRGHGGPDMPVWGDAFMRSRDGGTKETVKESIMSIVDYLNSLQVKPVH